MPLTKGFCRKGVDVCTPVDHEHSFRVPGVIGVLVHGRSDVNGLGSRGDDRLLFVIRSRFW